MIRNATMKDAESILKLVNENASKGLMLSKSPYAVYKDIQAYIVYEEEGKILGCARLNIAWNDLAEIASLAVDINERGKASVSNLFFTWLKEQNIWILNVCSP